MKKFTLLELMIVVAIIGILLTLLLPSLNKARSRARAVLCKSNTSNMYKGYIMHSKEDYNPQDSGPGDEFYFPALTNRRHGHKAGQLLGWGSINYRIKMMSLRLGDRNELNCPEYKVDSAPYKGTSSFGFNARRVVYLTGRIDQRLFLAQINSPSKLVLLGCRSNDNDDPWFIRKGRNRLAQYHPGNSGNVGLLDGTITTTTRENLLSDTSSPSLLDR